MPVIVGIDLGTTNSAAAIWKDGAAVLVPNSLGDFLTPSAVALAEDGSIVTGLAARERQVNEPSTARTLFKRAIGTAAPLSLGSIEFRAEELSAIILRSLKADVENFTGEKADKAVITVPAYFNDKQRKATRRAGELAGFSVERLINEPTAAALAYGIHELGVEEPFLVFDLGGGTFDVSLVEIFEGVIEVRSSAGDNRLGGEDFNAVLMVMAAERIRELDWEASGNMVLQAVLRDAAERARRKLSESDVATISLVWEGASHHVKITAADFEQRCEPLLARLREPVIRSLRDGRTKVEELSEIVMVGGATRMPVVRKAATRMFGRFPASRVHPDHAVALGAAIQGALRGKMAELEEIRLTDVCPFTLGVATSERLPNGTLRSGIFAPIIERNTVVPASRVETFSTLQNGQRRVELEIYQGEARAVEENILLGKLDVPVPQHRAGEVSVECRFSYDASGLLEVDVTVPKTGATRQIVILGDDQNEDEEAFAKRRQRLAALKVHPRENGQNAVLLARARRSYESFLGEQRAYVGSLLLRFEAALHGQDAHTIATVREDIGRALDELEGEQFL
ncbi:Hsp70 family protein [Sphingomonas qomolangmaensis]|uniref:Molecular chaperone HscC n=1 Tax=Sphingomonas qomolangmaensis TaxID=2918765 RepID=A0ABY5LDQ9_9SPHN|nr:molecular chaperone HscC [Sphingomonas qomolangmaensis]UUL84032.1 molecular chaperone HscC [Sphingomonas qomolangmaensis]